MKPSILLVLLVFLGLFHSAYAADPNNPFAAPPPKDAPSANRATVVDENAMFERFLSKLNDAQKRGRINLGVSSLAEGGKAAPKEVTDADVIKSVSYVGTFNGKHVYRSESLACYIHEIQLTKNTTRIVKDRCFDDTKNSLQGTTAMAPNK